MPVNKVTLTGLFYEQSGDPFFRVKLQAVLMGIDVETGQYVAQDTQIAYSDELGVATLPLFPNASGTRYSYYRITATTPAGVIISDSNVSIPNNDCNLADVEGNWSGEIFTGGANAIITGNLTVLGSTTLNNFTGNMTGGTIDGITSLRLPHGTLPPPTGEALVYWDDTADRLTVGTGTVAREMASVDGSQTLTNKSFDLGLNTLRGTFADFNAACTDNDFASINSPTFTGNPQAPTPAPGDNDASIATTAFVTTAVVNASGTILSNATPLIDGTATAGVGTKVSRDDHVHPTDTSRAPVSAATATGTSFTPSGNIAASNVQAALQELDTEKVSKSGDTMTGTLVSTASSTPAFSVTTPSHAAGRKGGFIGSYNDALGFAIGNYQDAANIARSTLSFDGDIITFNKSISDIGTGTGQVPILQITAKSSVPVANHFTNNMAQALWSYLNPSVVGGGNIGFAATLSDGLFSAWLMSTDRAGNMTIGGSLTQNASDGRLKENVKPISSPLETLAKINGVTFNWREDGPQPMRGADTGFVAQNIEEVFPQIVTRAGFDVAEDGGSKSGEDYKALALGNQITALLVEAVKELSAKVTALEAQLAAK